MTRHLNVYFPQMRTVSPQMTIQSWTSEHYHQHINPGRILRLQWFLTGPIVSFLAQRLGWKPCLFLLSPCDSGILWNTDSFLLGTACWIKATSSLLSMWSYILIMKNCMHGRTLICETVCVCACTCEKEREREPESIHTWSNRRSQDTKYWTSSLIKGISVVSVFL